MNFLKALYNNPVFIGRRLYLAVVILILAFVLSFFLPWLLLITKIAVVALAILTLVDAATLFLPRRPILANRICSDRFSNGDQNKVQLKVYNNFPFTSQIEIIDELPIQFQIHDFSKKVAAKSKESSIVEYSLRPVERGEYHFGSVLVYCKSPLQLLIRRIEFTQEERTIRVLPSYFLMRQYELKAFSNNLQDGGSKKIRKIGHSLEFEQIKEYVRGDDIRSINWKATARKGGLMVNNYTDEKSQQVYCLIDKGRVMKSPFNGLSLLDYAINASLILSRVALIKQDRAGLITFDHQIGQVVPASRVQGQMTNILETLYNQQTRYLETDYEKLYAQLKFRVNQRSLLILFTNFESMAGLERQLPYLRAISRSHLLLVVFFENTELNQITSQKAQSLEDIYMKTIAERFSYEKKRMVKELRKHGIFTILTEPENLTINTVNQYLELKSRQAI